MNVHIPQDLSYLRRLICERQKVLNDLGRGLAEKAVRGEEQYHYTGESARFLFRSEVFVVIVVFFVFDCW